jgi:hypothetical protein
MMIFSWPRSSSKANSTRSPLGPPASDARTIVLIRSISVLATPSTCTMLDTSACRRTGARTGLPVKAARSSAAIRYCLPIRTARRRPSRT